MYYQVFFFEKTTNNITDELNSAAMDFKSNAQQVRKQMWWKDFKMKLILGGM
jgi:hypothetical protein